MQKRVCRKYCKENKIKIINEYADENYSGRTLNRPSFKRMLKDKEINCILVYKLDRFGRDSSKMFPLIDHLEKRGVKLISATQKFDTSTPEGKFTMKLMVLLAEFESNLISARTIDGLRYRRKK